MLIEAMVAASLLVILSLGFLAAMDQAARSGSSIKSRGAAASIAQEDVERMRALKLRDLVNMSQTTTKTVNGVPYTVVSRAVWIDDTTGATSCPSGATRTDYLKVSSTVTWPAMGTTRPVTNETLVAVPLGSLDGTTGGLIVKIQNRNSVGVQGIPVSITGPSNNSGSTDSDGCVFWTGLVEGGYTINFGQSGWVDRSGVTNITQATSVTSGSTNSVVFNYDRASRLDVSFDTVVGGTTRVATSNAVMVGNSGMPSPQTRTFSAGSPQNTISTGSTLYPFTDGYAVWSGGCAGADPRAYGQSAPIVSLAPGATQAVTVREPAVRIQILRAGSPYPSARVRITPTTPGCGSTFTAALNATANLTEPGLPYGDYSICADDGTRNVTQTFQNRTPGGSAVVSTMSIPTSGTSGPCP
ncbi:MAG: hypothetical protein MUC84_02205 [Solirubrobacteraceae bacterium]|jgi:Tfp pilus assembly protein PilV|nr:hypothetical protein [Solirubrobacteraceae bacterium]